MSPLKIVLKTRDDPFFLDDWIGWHAALVGPENLVILDNGSTDPGVLAAYAAIRDRAQLVHFAGDYNDVHRPARFAEFYASLRGSCAHFLFLDTDEFLAWSDGRRLGPDRGSLAPLRDGFDGDFLPTTRLNCVELYRNRFFIGTDDVALRRQLKWSKPIIRSASSNWPDLINCNLHLRGALAPCALPGYFILHLNQLYPEQRIRNNVNKLVARGFMQPGEPLDAVLARQVPDGEWMIGIYVDEIRRMRPLEGRAARDDAPLAPGTLQVGEGGTLGFASGVEQAVFRGYIERFGEAVGEVIIEGRYPSA